MSECKCGLRTKLVGDGCEVCNPALAIEYANERIAELEGEYSELLARHNALVEYEAVLLGKLGTMEALKDRHNALVEAAKKMLDAYKRAEECSCPYCIEDFERERAEVDRLIADCKGEE